MTIAIFGGTFNPPHNEHINLIAGARNQLRADRAIVVPAAAQPLKQAPDVSAEDRFQMSKLAFEHSGTAEVSDFELSRGGSSYTWLTLEHFSRLYPSDRLVFVIGADSMLDVQDRWKNPGRIAGLCTLAYASRPGFEGAQQAAERFERTYGKEVIRLNQDGQDISSLELRALFEFDSDVSKWMPQRVIDYVDQKKLYRTHAALIQKAAQLLSPKRYAHTAYVTAEALRLARRTGCDEEKAFVAAALHDVAKKLSPQQLELYGYRAPEDMPEPVVHAFAGAHIAEREFCVTDKDVLNAIRYHTTGRPRMSLLERVIYAADCIERTRTYEGVQQFRDAVNRDFESGFVYCLAGTMELLDRENKSRVSRLTKLALDYYSGRSQMPSGRLSAIQKQED